MVENRWKPFADGEKTSIFESQFSVLNSEYLMLIYHHRHDMENSSVVKSPFFMVKVFFSTICDG